MVRMSTYNCRALPIWIIRSLLLLSAVSMLTSCAPVSAVVADNVPTWMGGMPKDVPPRRGTPEYDEWMKKRCHQSYDAQRRLGNENAQENKDHSQPIRHCPNIALSKRNYPALVETGTALRPEIRLSTLSQRRMRWAIALCTVTCEVNLCSRARIFK